MSRSTLQTLGSGGARRGGVNPAYVQPRAAAEVQLSGAQEETIVTLAKLLPGLRCGQPRGLCAHLLLVQLIGVQCLVAKEADAWLAPSTALKHPPQHARTPSGRSNTGA